MIKSFNLTIKDQEILENLMLNPNNIQDDHYDYSKVVVKKPWGYEYLIFSNKLCAVWILYLKAGAQTSMHCHPGKKTSLVVLEGKVNCASIIKSLDLFAGEGLVIDKGVFHQTTTISETGAFIMEIETPVNKRDLIRLKDKYGREGKGYETEEDHSFNTQNYNYISIQNLDSQHMLKKHFGQCSISFKKLTDEKDLSEILELNSEDIICILKGKLLYRPNKSVIEVGDVFTIKTLKQFDGLRISRNTEILVIKKIDRILKISDCVSSFLEEKNIKPVFVVPGEANVHLLDSIG